DGVPARKAMVVLLLHLSPGLARAFLGGRFGWSGGLGRRCLGGGRDRRARLADGFRLRLRRGLLRGRLLGGLRRVGIGALVGAFGGLFRRSLLRSALR